MKFVIPGNLTGLNEYTTSNRRNKFEANKLKQQNEDKIRWCILHGKVSPTENPIILKIKWFERDLKRDADNVVFAKKFILDALKKSQIIVDDSRRYVIGFDEIVLVDRTDPRIEVELIEMEKIYD